MVKKLSAFLIIGVLALISFLLIPKDKKISLLSPLPDFLTIISNSQASTLDLWLPAISTAENFDQPQITGRAALVYDLNSGRTLYSKNSKQKMPMASLTKIMTAVIAIDSKRDDDTYLVKKEYMVGESSMGLTEGETLNLEELLYGLVLHSGNDAAETLAGNYPGGRLRFIEAMNQKAKALGLKDTHFNNPSGLNGGTQFTTAYDLLVITRYALNNYPLFKQVVATPEHYIAQEMKHKEHVLINETNLLTTYPGVKGVKTGYTGEAGFCLVSYLEYKDQKVVGILLGSQNRREEMKILLDYSLKSLGITPPVHQ